ncbi:MAG: ABC transporter ATP-binding protein [Xanthobacteraceae bacterium]
MMFGAPAQMNLLGGHSIGQLASFVRLFSSSVPRRLQISGLVLAIGASLTEGISISLLGPLLALTGERTSSVGPAGNAAARLLHAVSLNFSLPLILAIFVGAVLCRALMMRKRDMVSFDLQIRFINAVRRRLYRAIQDAHWSFIARERLSHLVKALTADIDSVAMGTNLFLQIPAVALVSAVQLAIALSISPLLTLATIGCGGLVAILVRWRRGDAFQAGMRIMLARRATFDEISDFLASLKLAKSHNAEERHRLAFEEAVGHQHDNMLAYSRRTADARMLVQVAAAIMLGAFVYAGAEFSHLGTPELVIMIVVFARLVPGVMQIQQNAASMWQTLPVFNDLHRLIARCDAAKEPLIGGGTERLPLRDRIRLSGIRFRYDKVHGPDVLDGLDLEIAAGSAVAIVGASGVGKSTLADMLMGLQVPDAGSVSVDGQPLTGPRLAAWRRSMAYIPQENFLFNQSIRANLQWAAPDASDADLRRVLALTGADAVVATMPEGLDTVVGERGSRLSGGERQRLILARALLREPTLLILDEATNALDHDSERAVWTVIDRLRGSTTIVIIAHRLSSLRSADHIAVLDGGRIVQSGTFGTLASEGGGRVAALLRAGAVMEETEG